LISLHIGSGLAKPHFSSPPQAAQLRAVALNGDTGKERFGKFGCEWSMTDAETGRLLPETRLVGRPVCGDD
jgi:hypothetical protein